MVFTSADVESALKPNDEISPELTAPVIEKKLGYIVDYARIGSLDTTLTMGEIVTRVTTSRHKPSPASPISPTR